MKDIEREYLENYDNEVEIIGYFKLTEGDDNDYFSKGNYTVFYDKEATECYFLIDDDGDSWQYSTLVRLRKCLTDRVPSECVTMETREEIKKQLVKEQPTPLSFDNIIDLEVEELIPKPLVGSNNQSATVITKTIETKGETTMMNANIFGAKTGLVQVSGVQLDIDGNLGVNGRFIKPTGSVADLGALNNDFLQLIASSVDIDKAKVGDLVLDDKTGNPVFVLSVENIKNGEITFRCLQTDDRIDRTPQKNAIMGKATLTKLSNLFTLIGAEKLQQVAPLISYGEEKVMNLVVQQVIRTGTLDIKQLEMEPKP